jgi:hypothetical protein
MALRLALPFCLSALHLEFMLSEDMTLDALACKLAC